MKQHARTIVGTLLLAAMVGVAAGATAKDPAGYWVNEKETVVMHVQHCDDSLCGRIAWLKKPYEKDGSMKRDRENPRAELRDRPLCDLEILYGFEAEREGRWANGNIYNPEDGSVYQSQMEMVSADELKVRGYVFLPVFGKTLAWQRVYAPPGECQAEAAAADQRVVQD